MSRETDERIKRVGSAARNMSVLVDEIAKTARKNFKEKGEPDVDAKFLKDSVGALRELFDLLGDAEGEGSGDNSVLIKIEKEAEEWSK